MRDDNNNNTEKMLYCAYLSLIVTINVAKIGYIQENRQEKEERKNGSIVK